VCSSDLTGATFLLSGTTFNATTTIQPKQGQRFIGQTGTVINGGGSTLRAFRGAAHDCLFARMRFQNFGGGPARQNVGVIDAKSGDWDEGSTVVAHDWRIHDCTFYNNANVGVIMGHRFTVDECDFQRHNPHAIGGGFFTGGLVWGNYFKDNGFSGASGEAVNNAQVKFAFTNVGPWGTTNRDTSRFVLYSGAPFGGTHHNYETPSRTILAHNVFDNTRTPGYGTGDNARSLWFDLDCRDFEVAYNTLIGSHGFGVFVEGCNGGWIHHNEFNGHTSSFFNSLSGGTWINAYWGQGAVVADVSDNIDVEDNLFHNCSGGSVIFFLGERGRNGADWVTPTSSGGFPVASDAWNQMIRRTFAAAAVGEASTVGMSNCSALRNTLTGTSVGVGYVARSNMNIATEGNPGTFAFDDNDYSGATGFRNFWNKLRYDSLAAWRSATGFDTP
jgi:hypothetical protein